MVHPAAGGDWWYPPRPELLDRKVLVDDLQRLEKKLYASTRKSAQLERQRSHAAALGAQTKAERRRKVRLEEAVLATFARLLALVEAWEGEPLPAVDERLRIMLRHEAERGGSVRDLGDELLRRLEAALPDPPGRAAVEEENARLRAELEASKARAAHLEAELERQRIAHLQELKAKIDATLDKTAFRTAVLDLLGQLSTAVHRRLGFIPADTRKDMHAFVAYVTETTPAASMASLVPLDALAGA